MAGALRLVPVACLVLLVPLAVGHTETMGGVAPSAIDLSGFGGVGAIFCQRENPAAPYGCGGTDVSAPFCQDVDVAAPLGCPGYCHDGNPNLDLHCRSANRFGIDFDVSTAAWGLNGATLYATGFCSVSNLGAIVQNGFSFTCGTDRDDDTYVTNADNSPNDAGTMSMDPDGWDDDFAAVSSNGSQVASRNVCLRSDIALWATALGVIEESTGAVVGDGSWDDVVFFVRQEGTLSVPTLGAVQATLTLSPNSGCGAGSTVSGHTHG